MFVAGAAFAPETRKPTAALNAAITSSFFLMTLFLQTALAARQASAAGAVQNLCQGDSAVAKEFAMGVHNRSFVLHRCHPEDHGYWTWTPRISLTSQRTDFGCERILEAARSSRGGVERLLRAC